MSRPEAPEFHVWETDADPVALDRVVDGWRLHLAGRRVLDVGCGEGHFLAALRRAGLDAEGVELTPELAARAQAKGLPVHDGDALAFLREHGRDFGAFVLLDFIEHVPFEVGAELLALLPEGAVVIVQTPNTNSLVGHQFYLQVPSHLAPYSPFVLGRLLGRLGYETLQTGTMYGGLPWTGLRRRVTEWMLVKLLGTVTTRLLSEGANFFVVARRGGPAMRP